MAGYFKRDLQTNQETLELTDMNQRVERVYKFSINII